MLKNFKSIALTEYIEYIYWLTIYISIMRKWHSVFFLMLLSNMGWAQSGIDSDQQSPTVFIIIGIVLLVIVIFMLYNKQKRKYND